MRQKLVRSLLALGAVLHLAIPAGAAGQVATRESHIIDAHAVTKAPDPLRRPVSVDANDMPLSAVLNTIVRQAQLGLIYNSDSIPVDQVVTLQLHDTPAGEALQLVLAGTDVHFALSRNNHVVLSRRPASTSAQTARPAQKTGVIMGRVIEVGASAPIPGAQILIDSVGRGITNSDGMYRITGVAPGKHTVSVISIGHRGQSREVEVGEGATVTVSFALEAAPTQLSELIVTATGEERRRVELGHDIVVINADSIVKHEPISSVADLLEGRVPGLVMQRTSGTPGDPTRIRIRGVSSPNLSNDPIIVVDGVRVYSNQSSSRDRNLASNGHYAAPSPLDYLPPSMIETIQVIKGPSASTMYGQDAANGVIVITTKRGRPGKTQWTASVDHGQAHLPGNFPQRYVRFGRTMTDDRRVVCPVNRWLTGYSANAQACLPDDEVHSFQTLADPHLTVLGRGHNTAVNLGVSGGVGGITYSVNASYSDQVGIIKLSDFEIGRFRSIHGRDPFDWMKRPQQYTIWGVQSNVRAQLGPTMTVSLSSNLSRNQQQRSELERSYIDLDKVYFDKVNGHFYDVGTDVIGTTVATMVPGEPNVAFYDRVTSATTRFTNSLNLNWRPQTWLTIDAVAGLNVDQRTDANYVPSGYVVNDPRLVHGKLRRGHGTAVTSTIDLRAFSQVPLGLGFSMRLGAGVNYKGESIGDMVMGVDGLPEGVSSIIGTRAGFPLLGQESRSNLSTYGWYIEPGLAHRRMWLNFGLRLDGGTSFGTNVKLPAFPKLSYSYLISDEPYFPDALRSVFSELRLRVAYGHAGRQPRPTHRLRLYSAASTAQIDGRTVEITGIESIGNTQLKPERSQEFEGGFDAGLFDDRFTINLTAYHQTTKDALLSVPVAPSVYGDIEQLQNIGVIRNTGVELALGFEAMRSDLVTWRMELTYDHNRNKVLELGPGVEPFWTHLDNVSHGVQNSPIGVFKGVNGIRAVPGFPLEGRWSTPVLGYDDANGNGILEENEVVFGDTAVYVGSTLPKFTAGLQTSLSLFRGALLVTANLTYTDGMSQWNRGYNPMLARGWHDPTATSLFDQLQFHDRAQFSRIETVYALRFNTLSIGWQVPREWAARVGASSLNLSIQGRNLGLLTNYSGLDPNVNSELGGWGVTDSGVLPSSRSFQIRLNATY